MVKVVFIDIDDTLLSFSGSVREIMRTGFAEFGLPACTDGAYAVFERVNAELWRRIERGELDLPGLERIRWNAIFDELVIDFDGIAFEAYFRRKLFSSAISAPHALELVRYLSERYTLCAASNGPYEQQINRLRTAGMLDLFDHVFISSKMGAEKPSRAFFDACFAELRAAGLGDLRPEETMIIGDSMTSDIAGGAAYGMQTCLYRPAAQPSVPEPAPNHIISNLMDAKAFL